MFYLLLVWRKFIILNLDFVGDDVDERRKGDRMDKENKKTRKQGDKETRRWSCRRVPSIAKVMSCIPVFLYSKFEENKNTRRREYKKTRQ